MDLRVRGRDLYREAHVPLDAYHGVRAHDDWFLIKHGHETLEVETVVDQREGYVVVENLRL